MEVTEKLVDHLANLSRLEFDADQKQAIMKDLQKMIAFVDKLNELDTTGVEPLRHMSAGQTVLRPDEPGPAMPNAEALAPAAESRTPFFTVPKFIHK